MSGRIKTKALHWCENHQEWGDHHSDRCPGSSDAVEALDRMADFALLPDHVKQLGERLQRDNDALQKEVERLQQRIENQAATIRWYQQQYGSH